MDLYIICIVLIYVSPIYENNIVIFIGKFSSSSIIIRSYATDWVYISLCLVENSCEKFMIVSF